MPEENTYEKFLNIALIIHEEGKNQLNLPANNDSKFMWKYDNSLRKEINIAEDRIKVSTEFWPLKNGYHRNIISLYAKSNYGLGRITFDFLISQKQNKVREIHLNSRIGRRRSSHQDEYITRNKNLNAEEYLLVSKFKLTSDQINTSFEEFLQINMTPFGYEKLMSSIDNVPLMIV